MGSKRRPARRSGRLALGILAAALVCATGLYRLWERPPALSESPAPQLSAPAAEQAARLVPAAAGASLSGEERVPTRLDGVYTILLAGSDAGNGNTDTLILCRLDTVHKSMDFVSLPRDTLINVPWEVRKLNSVYWGACNNGGDGLAALKTQVARLTGFVPDCCAVADLELFTQAVDLIGGVYFDVPMDMDYEDPSQKLQIHLKAGPQLLDGSQALGLCRFRSGYVMGDLDRIDMQQQFLRASLSQFLSLGSIPRTPELIRLLAEGLTTDMNTANLLFFLRQALQCESADLRFVTAPTRPETIAGYSYAVLEPERWLDVVNEYLNPYDAPIGLEQLDIVYRSGDAFAATAALRDAGYYTRGAAD